MEEKTELKELDFQILFGAIKHFGKNLYTTNPPAIAELVANAWDAYATECKIMFINDGLLIIDNGIGMTDEEFNSRPFAWRGKETIKRNVLLWEDDMTLRGQDVDEFSKTKF